MSNESKNLQQLWQKQSISPIDVNALKKQWQRIRVKQFLYIILDALPVIALPVFILLVPKKLSNFEFYWISGIFILSSGWFAYMLWLRRYSLGFKVDSNSTSQYVQQVKLQYQQNIQIAYLNKQLCFIVPLVFAAYIGIGFLGDYVEQDILWKKAKLIFIFLLICMPLTWIWAHKRQQKFTNLLKDFEARWSS